MTDSRYINGKTVTATTIDGAKPEFGNTDHITVVKKLEQEDKLDSFVRKNNNGNVASWPKQTQSVEIECHGCSRTAEGDSFDDALYNLGKKKSLDSYELFVCKHCDFIFDAEVE